MKKLVIFLIPFIISISAYALDESLVTENFSLIKDPGSNNRGFLNFKVSFPSSYLFFNENKRHSRQHQTFQIFKFHQYSESLAEFYLKRTAERSKKRRKTGGIIGVVAGGGLMVLGAAMISKEEEGWFDFSSLFGTVFIISGAACVGGGIYSLAVPSRAERELDDVLSISDRTQREKASHEALSLLAARGRRNRILAGILSAAFAVGSLVGESPEYAYGAPYAALAVYSFVMKSPAERAFQDYLRERKREQQKELVMRVGIMPYGGVKISLALSF